MGIKRHVTVPWGSVPDPLDPDEKPCQDSPAKYRPGSSLMINNERVFRNPDIVLGKYLNFKVLRLNKHQVLESKKY